MAEESICTAFLMHFNSGSNQALALSLKIGALRDKFVIRFQTYSVKFGSHPLPPPPNVITTNHIHKHICFTDLPHTWRVYIRN